MHVDTVVHVVKLWSDWSAMTVYSKAMALYVPAVSNYTEVVIIWFKLACTNFSTLYPKVTRPVTTDLDPHPLFCSPWSIYFKIFGPGPYISEIYGPPHMLSIIADSEGSGAGFWVWMVSRVSFQSLYGRVSLQGMHGGSEYFGDPNITWQTLPSSRVGSD